jgi:chorismate mutase-like protein
VTAAEAQAKLAECRKRIDQVDINILRLLNERTAIVETIGSVKKEAEFPVYEPKREEEVFRNVTENNRGPLPEDAVRRIFERIIDEMRMLQKMRMNR